MLSITLDVIIVAIWLTSFILNMIDLKKELQQTRYLDLKGAKRLFNTESFIPCVLNGICVVMGFIVLTLRVIAFILG